MNNINIREVLSTYFSTIKIYLIDRFRGEGEKKRFFLLTWFFFLFLWTMELCGPIMLAHDLKSYNAPMVFRMILGILSIQLATWAAFMLNDISDREADALTSPWRPLPKGTVKVNYLLAVSISFILTGYLLSYLISIPCLIAGVVHSLFCFIHYGYTKKRLRVPATSELLTALQMAIFPIYCFFVAGNYDFKAILLLTLFIYIADVSHDIAGGIKDKEGDLKNRVMTFAASYGETIAARSCLALFLIAVLLAVFIWLKTFLGFVFLAIMLASALYTLPVHMRLVRNPTIENGGRSFDKGADFIWITFGGMVIDILIQYMLI